MKPEEQIQSSAEGFFLCQTAYNYWRRNPAASDSRDDKDGKVQRHLGRGDHGKTNRSHSAISHHLQIIKEAEIVKVLKAGAMNFNYFGPVMETLERR